MNMFEEARSLDGMIKMRRLSQNQAAKMLGVSQSYVANKIRLLGLKREHQDRIIATRLSERHARALLRLEEDLRSDALEKIIERGLTVSESEALIDFMNTHNLPKKVGNADRLRAIDIFLDGMKKSLTSLSSIGITSSHKISYLGSKTVITIFIENG